MVYGDARRSLRGSDKWHLDFDGARPTFTCEGHARVAQGMTFLEAYVLFGIPLILLAIGGAGLLWAYIDGRAGRRRQSPGE